MNYFIYCANILGGLALFLFGVEQCSEFFRRGLGSDARNLMARYTKHSYQSFLFGVLLSAVTQSSTIATSFAVSFVDVGLLTFAGSIVVMMGASLGGTFVSFLLSLNLFNWAPLIFGVSFFLCKVKNAWFRGFFGLLRCLALIFTGMMILSIGTDPLFQDPNFRELIMQWVFNGWVMGFIAFLGSGVLQSSSAIMALGLALAASNALPSTSCLPIALGAHIGSTTMVVLSGMTGKLSAKRLGIATFLYKLLGGMAFLAVLPWVHEWMLDLGLTPSQELVYGQILIALFNMVVFLPFPHLLEALAKRLVSGEGDLGIPRYIADELLPISPVAVLLLSREVARLSNFIEAYLQMLLEPQQRIPELFDKLPESIVELYDACQDYAYRIRLSSDDDEELKRRFSSISYTVTVFRSLIRLLCGGLRNSLTSEKTQEALKARIGADRWEHWAKMSRKMMRTCLRAFVIGEKGLVNQTTDQELELEEESARIRQDLGEDFSYDRDASRVIALITMMQGLLGTAKEVAEGEEFARLRKYPENNAKLEVREVSRNDDAE